MLILNHIIIDVYLMKLNIFQTDFINIVVI